MSIGCLPLHQRRILAIPPRLERGSRPSQGRLRSNAGTKVAIRQGAYPRSPDLEGQVAVAARTKMVSQIGVEPTTFAFEARCTSIVLLAHDGLPCRCCPGFSRVKIWRLKLVVEWEKLVSDRGTAPRHPVCRTGGLLSSSSPLPHAAFLAVRAVIRFSLRR